MTTLTDLIAEASASGCTHAPLPIEEVEALIERLEHPLWVTGPGADQHRLAEDNLQDMEQAVAVIRSLQAKLSDAEALIATQDARIRHLENVATEYVDESCWNAFNDGVVKDDLWMDGGMSTGEWLQHGLGLPYERVWHPVEEVKAGIPGLVARIVKGEAT